MAIIKTGSTAMLPLDLASLPVAPSGASTLSSAPGASGFHLLFQGSLQAQGGRPLTSADGKPLPPAGQGLPDESGETDAGVAGALVSAEAASPVAASTDGLTEVARLPEGVGEQGEGARGDEADPGKAAPAGVANTGGGDGEVSGRVSQGAQMIAPAQGGTNTATDEAATAQPAAGQVNSARPGAGQAVQGQGVQNRGLENQGIQNQGLPNQSMQNPASAILPDNAATPSAAGQASDAATATASTPVAPSGLMDNEAAQAQAQARPVTPAQPATPAQPGEPGQAANPAVPATPALERAATVTATAPSRTGADTSAQAAAIDTGVSAAAPVTDPDPASGRVGSTGAADDAATLAGMAPVSDTASGRSQAAASAAEDGSTASTLAAAADGVSRANDGIKVPPVPSAIGASEAAERVTPEAPVQPAGTRGDSARLNTELPVARQEALAQAMQQAGAEGGDTGDSGQQSRQEGQAAAALASASRSAGSPATQGLQAEPGFEQRLQQQLAEPRWGRQVGERAIMMAQHGPRTAHIQLDPPELGAMQIRIHLQGQDQVSVSFTSANPAVREALEQQLPRLREMFADQGLNLQDSSVSDEARRQGSGQREQAESQGRSGGYAGGEGGEGEGLPAPVAALGLVDYYA